MLSIPKYTFLLPAYKGRFLDEMLRSIQFQTYTDFKVIISDDCSPEDLYGICKSYLDDPRFSYRRNETNIGGKDLVAHWNLLVDMCDSDYLILASDDDVYATTFLEEVDTLVRKYPLVDLIHARANMIDGDGIVLKIDAPYHEYVSQLVYIYQYEYFNHIECVANNIYKTSAIKSIGGFVNFPLAWASDTATNFSMSKNGAANTRDILFSFRMSGENISSDNNESREVTQKKFEAIMMFEKYFEDLIKSISVPTKEEKELLKVVFDYHRFQHIKNAACYYSSSLSFDMFISFVRDFRNRGYFSNKYEMFLLFKRWLYKHCRRSK